MKDILSPQFCITIDFDKSTENPSRVFQTMTHLIQSFQSFDSKLVKGLSHNLEPCILLEDIEKGSLKTWLSSKIKGIPDETIENVLDPKKIIGLYLVKAKYIIINKLEGKTEITSAKDISDIQQDLLGEAESTRVKNLPLYEPIPQNEIIKHLSDIGESLSYLKNGDSAYFEDKENRKANFNLKLNFSSEAIEDLLTKESLTNESDMILKVKKPDYLGGSMWEFNHNNKNLNARITHKDWVIQFQQRKIDIRPKDSIKARVVTTVKYGHDNNVIGTSYEIKEVKEVLTLNNTTQGKLIQ